MQRQRPSMIKTPSNRMHLPCGDSSIQINKNRLPYDWVLRRTSFYVYIVSTIDLRCTDTLYAKYTLCNGHHNSSSPLRSVCLLFYLLRLTILLTSLLFEWRRRRLCTHPNNKTTSSKKKVREAHARVRGIIQQSTWWQIKQYTIHWIYNNQPWLIKQYNNIH